jgi:hypothetical protein
VNEPTDIKALDEYLKGGSDISQHYRELGHDDVPPELDRRVLEAARAAVADEGARRSRTWLRWSAPVALAASVVLVVTVVIENGVPKDTVYVAQPASEESKEDSKLYREAPAVAPQFVPEAPAPELAAVAPPPPAAPQPASEPERSLAKAELRDKRVANVVVPEEITVAAKARRDQMQDSPVAVSSVVDAAEQQLAGSAAVPVPRERAEAETDSDVSEVSVTGSRARRATGRRTAGPRSPISGPSLSGEMRQSADTAAQAEQPEPEKWLEEIRDLRRKGRIVDADREWQQFVEAYPDFEVADDDIARKH